MNSRNNFSVAPSDDNDGFYEISYTKNIMPTKVQHRLYQDVFINGLKPQAINSSFKIRKKDLNDFNDLKKTNWTINSSELHAYIRTRLQTLLGFDFDETLTNEHTFYMPMTQTTDKTNLKGGEETREVLRQCKENGNFIMFVVTNNTKEKIGIHLPVLEVDYFSAIKTRLDFHNSGGDKEYCFREMYDQKMEQCIIDQDGFLDFKKEGIIDIVDAVLVEDDEKAKEKFGKYGIKVISVEKTKDDTKHLEKLKKLCLGIPLIEEVNDQNNNNAQTNTLPSSPIATNIATHHATTFSSANKSDDQTRSTAEENPTKVRRLSFTQLAD